MKVPDPDMFLSQDKNLIISGDTAVPYQAVKEYLKEIWSQYKKADRKTRSMLLSEVCRNTGLHRKSVIRMFSKKYAPRRFHGYRGGRGKVYSSESKYHLKALWKEMGYMCAERMHAALGEWIVFYEHKLFTESMREEILRMSVSSIKRFLGPARSQLRRKMNTGTRRTRKFITKVPIRQLGVTPTELGHCEIDCVAHCGGSLAGEFAWTLTLTDIVSGWTECEAMWCKNGFGVKNALELIEKRLPFSLKALYMDNGSEFMNSDVIDKFATKNRKENLQVFRSRPYKKNDQCYVEQKNYTHVRHLFGYARIDWKPAVNKMNHIYRKEWTWLQNYFCPQQKLLAKIRIGSKVKRKMSLPITPYQRLINLVSDTQRKILEQTKSKLNPIWLRKNQKQKTKSINSNLTMTKQERGKMAI